MDKVTYRNLRHELFYGDYDWNGVKVVCPLGHNLGFKLDLAMLGAWRTGCVAWCPKCKANATITTIVRLFGGRTSATNIEKEVVND